MTRYFLFSILLLIPLTTGCGKAVQVGGRAVFTDGEPLAAGKVAFENEKYTFVGKIRADGTFSLGQLKDGEGVPPGRYQAYIAEAWHYEAVKDGLPKRHELIAEKHRKKETSDLEYEITSSMKNLVITVDRAKK